MSAIKARFKERVHPSVSVEINHDTQLLTLMVKDEGELLMTPDEVLAAIVLLQESLA